MSWRRRLLGFFLATALVLVPAEFLLRRINFAPAGRDPVLGSIREPGSVSRHAVEGDGRSSWIVHGLRREQPMDPDADTILALGDSYTEAAQIDDDEVFTYALEQALRRGGLPFQVLNAGKSGYSPADYVDKADFYRGLGANRWTIIQLRDADLEEDGWKPVKNHFARMPDGTLGIQHVDPPRSKFGWIVRPVLNNSALISYAIERFLEFRSAAAAEPPLFRAAGKRAESAPRNEPYPVEEELELLHRSFDGLVTFLYLAVYDPEHPIGGGVTDVEQRLVAVCLDRGWSCVNLRDAFPDFAARRIAPFGFANTAYNNGHLNADGHQAAAMLLEREMERLRAGDLL
jgi:lysophospholipase L1-like esterase